MWVFFKTPIFTYTLFQYITENCLFREINISLDPCFILTHVCVWYEYDLWNNTHKNHHTDIFIKSGYNSLSQTPHKRIVASRGVPLFEGSRQKEDKGRAEQAFVVIVHIDCFVCTAFSVAKGTAIMEFNYVKTGSINFWSVSAV